MPRTTTREKAEAHEALFLRLLAALDQLTPLATRHPDTAVPDATRAIAEGLLFDARPFTSSFFPSPRPGEGGAKRRVRGLPPAAGTVAALASQLAQARAMLEMWEAEHSGWDGACFVWRLTRGDAPLPIQRLRAKAKLPADTAEDRRSAEALREMLWRRIDARFGEGYDRGYADARDGLPNRKAESYPRRVFEG